MAQAAKKAKRGKKQRKFGRNAAYCQAYAASRRREHNKLRRIRKHLRRHFGDGVAKVAEERLSLLCIRLHGGMATQGSAKARIPVRFRVWPPRFLRSWREWIGTTLLRWIRRCGFESHRPRQN